LFVVWLNCVSVITEFLSNWAINCMCEIAIYLNHVLSVGSNTQNKRPWRGHDEELKPMWTCARPKADGPNENGPASTAQAALTRGRDFDRVRPAGRTLQGRRRNVVPQSFFCVQQTYTPHRLGHWIWSGNTWSDRQGMAAMIRSTLAGLALRRSSASLRLSAARLHSTPESFSAAERVCILSYKLDRLDIKFAWFNQVFCAISQHQMLYPYSLYSPISLGPVDARRKIIVFGRAVWRLTGKHKPLD
jgi:hypothetical protein